MLHEKKGISLRSKSVHQHQENLNEHLQDISIYRKGKGTVVLKGMDWNQEHAALMKMTMKN